jgi:tetratricopeptide (TPR) repeat protein
MTIVIIIRQYHRLLCGLFSAVAISLLLSTSYARAAERGTAHDTARIAGLKSDIEESTRQLKADPNDVGALYKRGRAYNDLGKSRQAIADFTRCIKLKPDFVDAYGFRVQAYSVLHQNRKTINDLDTVISLQPKNAFWYEERGLSFFQIGNYQKAIDDCTQAIKLEPAFAAYSTRADAYDKLGKHDLAMQDREVAKTLPSNGTIAPQPEK